MNPNIKVEFCKQKYATYKIILQHSNWHPSLFLLFFLVNYPLQLYFSVRSIHFTLVYSLYNSLFKISYISLLLQKCFSIEPLGSITSLFMSEIYSTLSFYAKRNKKISSTSDPAQLLQSLLNYKIQLHKQFYFNLIQN